MLVEAFEDYFGVHVPELNVFVAFDFEVQETQLGANVCTKIVSVQRGGVEVLDLLSEDIFWSIQDYIAYVLTA